MRRTGKSNTTSVDSNDKLPGSSSDSKSSPSPPLPHSIGIATLRPHERTASWRNLLSPRSPGVEVPELHSLLTEVFENPDDVAAFADALRDDAGKTEHAHELGPLTADELAPTAEDDYPGATTLKSPGLDESTSKNESSAEISSHSQHRQNSHQRKIGKISATSDFAPVREKTSHKASKKHDSGSRQGPVYAVLRFPLLVAVWLAIIVQFLLYVLVRQCVNVIEYLSAWRGERGRLRRKLRASRSWEEWTTTAKEMDEFGGFGEWRYEDASGLYDWRLVKKVTASLKAFRERDDAENLLGVLDLCIRNNFAGIENFRLYSETYFGTKFAIEAYLQEAERGLEYVRTTEKLAIEHKRQFYRNAAKNLGKSALCLSGGGSFGYYHIGLVRALLDADLLPSIITGTSAGGLIAALACTRTKDELKHILVPALADRITACEESITIWGPRAWRTGARFDLVPWAEKAQYFTMGSLTFLEAYKRTGKILNISVVPADRHSPTILLNIISAPHCIIWSALLASAAVPGILNPVCLMSKDPKTGQAKPWNWGHRFKDGSLRVDIPLQDLHALYNVNYPIVSQVNPHVHLFFYSPQGAPGRPVAHRKGKGWRGGFLLSAAEHVLKLHLSVNFKVVRDLDLMPTILGADWSQVFLQRFAGAVTIWPRTRAWDWVRILSDPDRKELARMMQIGRTVTFPKLHMISNRRRLEAAVEQGRLEVRRAVRQRAAEQRTPAAAEAGLSTSADKARLSDESANDPGDFFLSKKLSDGARPRLFPRLSSYASAQLSDEGNATPTDVETPGEFLPRRSRLRSANDADVRQFGGSKTSRKGLLWLRGKGNVDEDGDDATPASVTNKAHSGVVENDFANKPLTAAALSPRGSTHAKKWRRGSMRSGDHQNGFFDEGESNSSSEEDEDS
ncbi:patatin-domain-containing protein [Ceraceosorus guamensis]|uniref:Patatin-domain-containing protein n=1 Tax=Ceraceosorus guamensis TaxID=1522189 RepID=A0A316W1Z7_9BASI|nr:patatin-domain-containing protein [Ceraceosorus guamensis]PWN43699.1 patatin-domain-containing protein [Ceraceosorus guamensis]